MFSGWPLCPFPKIGFNSYSLWKPCQSPVTGSVASWVASYHSSFSPLTQPHLDLSDHQLLEGGKSRTTDSDNL
jgi:hypothetical protein